MNGTITAEKFTSLGR